MKTKKHMDFPLAAMAAALLSVYGSAWAQVQIDDEILDLTKPASSVGVGIGYTSSDAPRFGIYSDLNDEDAYALINIDINKLDVATGTWLKIYGRNLGLETRELRFTHERQGDWAYYLDYSETPRFDPLTVRSKVTGIGSTSLTIPRSQDRTGSEVGLKMKREMATLGFNKQLGGGFDVNVRLRNEEKNGARLWGRGDSQQSALEFMPEPINSTTQQLDAIIGYTGDRLHLNGGYYGSFYDNNNNALNITDGTVANLRSHTLVGLPPDNEAHQLHFGGGYSFTATTKGTFKLSYARAAQNDTFVPLEKAVANDLDARVDTTRVQFGVTSRPMPKLSLLANVSMDDREDKTPVRRYVDSDFTLPSTRAYFTGKNEPRSVKTSSGRLEASYRLPMDTRVTGGFDYVEKKREIYEVRATAFREKTEEASWRLLLQRSMSETVNGSIEYVKSDRHGSPIEPSRQGNLATGVLHTPGLQAITPIHLMDREREKVKLSVTWAPIEALSLQFSADEAYDNYDQRTAAAMGVRTGKVNNYAIDVAYAFADAWQATAWISRNENKTDQAGGLMNGDSPIPRDTAWFAALRNTGNSFGLGLRGKPYERLDIGFDLSHSEIVDEYGMRRLDTGAAITTQPPPPHDVFTRQSRLKLFGTYAIEKNASIRLDYIYDRFHTNDWTWRTASDSTTWTYSDGTQVTQAPKQNVNFVGITYIYRFY